MISSTSEPIATDAEPQNTRRPSIQVMPVSTGAVLDVLLPGVRKKSIDLRIADGHLILDGRPDFGPDYHLDLEITSGADDDGIHAVIADGRVSVIVRNPQDNSGCELRPAA